MENYEPNDFVYVQEIGFCQLVSCGRHKTLKLKKRQDSSQPAIEPVLRKQKESISFEPDSYMMFGNEPSNPAPADGEPEAVAVPQQQTEQTKKPQPTASTSEARQEVEDDGSPNVVSLKIAKTNVMVYTPDSNLTKTIRLYVKTFFGSRQELEVTLSISSTILQLKNRIIQLSKEPAGNIDNARLISCSNGLLVEYANPKEFLYATKLRQNSKLLMLATIRFTMDPTCKGPSINLTNSNRTIGKQGGESGYELCLGIQQSNIANTTMYSGRHYFEAKIDKLSEEEDVVIGVARKSAKLSTTNITEEPFWGYLCLAGRKLGLEADSTEHIKDYGPCCKVNDIVGILIHFDSKGRCSLSFYVNSKFLGRAFHDIEGPLLPCIAFGTSPHMQVSLNTAAEIPFELSNFS